MKILSVNIRATQGGAGRMGYDLHRRLAIRGEDSRILYGYGSGIKPDPKAGDQQNVRWLGSRAAVLANYASHWMLGHEIITAGKQLLAQEIEWAEIIHIHAPHHYYLRWDELVDILDRSSKPVVMTAHDWWLVSGRCGFVRDCTGWKRECGECGKRRFEDLPSLLDRSRTVRSARHTALRRLRNHLTIVCPSKHLMEDHRTVFPDLHFTFIPNGLDLEFENIPLCQKKILNREAIVFCASDLASPGKIDGQAVRTLATHFGARIQLVGRGSPFHDTLAKDLGEIRSRDELVRIFYAARSLVFTSQMDNAPLTIIEALSSGAYVVAYPSAAASEMLLLVGGRCANNPQEALELVIAGREADLFGGQDHMTVMQRARAVWSGEAMASEYLKLYGELVDNFALSIS